RRRGSWWRPGGRTGCPRPTSIKASTALGVRCSRVRSAALRRRPGTVRKISVGATSRSAEYVNEIPLARQATVRKSHELRTVSKILTSCESTDALVQMIPKGSQMPRQLPAPWRAEKIHDGYLVRDANGQALAYVPSRTTEVDAIQAKVLTEDE